MHWIALQPQPEAALPEPLAVLGWWALQFTPKVALLADAVLLEVSASERLWHGRAALLRHIYTSNKPVALAGYARGATSLVALGRLLAAQPGSTPADALPLSALLAAQPHLATLGRIGCRTWGELRALPRDGLARRFGADLLAALDQAYGTRPDVYPWLTLPEVFEARLELLTHIDSAPAMLFGARRLLAQLQVWLQLRQQGVLAIELGWTMDARRNTGNAGALLVRTAEASAQTAHLQRLLAERLAQVTLAAPVQSLRLRSVETRALVGQSASLLPEEQLPGDSLAQTIERLSARLGPDKVLRLQARADHRPEHRQAWVAATDTITSIAVSANKTRATGQKGSKHRAQTSGLTGDWASPLCPTWLLAEPLKLAVFQQRPHYQGPLKLLSGPQRLEAGWWPLHADAAKPDGSDELALGPGKVAHSRSAAPSPANPGLALRDYFVARSASSALLWIYRERLPGADAAQSSSAWYLHGIFA